MGEATYKEFSKQELGKAMASYMYLLKTVETNIGDIRDRKGEYRVSGVQYVGNKIDLLSPIDVPIEVTDKFIKRNNVNALVALKEYLNTIDGTEYNDLKNKVIKRYKNINNNKEFPMPFNIGGEYLVEYEVDGRTKRTVEKISMLEWSIKKNNGNRIEGTVYFKLSDGNGVIKVPFTEYGKKFKARNMETNISAAVIEEPCIRVNRFGMIKPIVVEDENVSIAIDGMNLYYDDGFKIYIIGGWDANGNIVGDIPSEVADSKAYEFILKNQLSIKRNKRFIAAYLSVAENIINI